MLHGPESSRAPGWEAHPAGHGQLGQDCRAEGLPTARGSSPGHRPLVPGARPGHCVCTSSQLKPHRRPFLGKKSGFSIQVCGRESPGSGVMKPPVLVANK